VRPERSSAHRVVAVISGAAWVWSWYTMYLEVHRWNHLTTSLRFNPGPPIPGTTFRPRPGLPFKALYVCAAGSPPVFAAAIAAMARTRAVTRHDRSGHRPAIRGD